MAFGYLTLDHRASPGLPPEFARRMGVPSGSILFEADTLTCAHCKTVQIKNLLRTRERASCWKCNNHYICDICAWKARQPDYNHLPFEKIVDIVQKTPLGSPTELLFSPK
jgi:hypothetical protein